MFPVSLASEAKRLGFSAEELKNMVLPTDNLKFKNVGINRASGLHHSSSASKLFHDDLISQLKNANNKMDAQNIINKMHKDHVEGYDSNKIELGHH